MNENEKKYWDNKASFYNLLFDNAPQHRKMYEFVRNSPINDMDVLEVGTGTGMIARRIADKVKSVRATDYSEEMIAVAKSIPHAEHVHFSYADIFSLPFAEKSFDAVIAANILHIIPNAEKALAEIRRVLKPQGVLIAPTFMWKTTTLKGKIAKIMLTMKRFPIHNHWDKNSYEDFLQNNGFIITRRLTIPAYFTMHCVSCGKQ